MIKWRIKPKWITSSVWIYWKSSPQSWVMEWVRKIALEQNISAPSLLSFAMYILYLNVASAMYIYHNRGRFQGFQQLDQSFVARSVLCRINYGLDPHLSIESHSSYDCDCGIELLQFQMMKPRENIKKQNRYFYIKIKYL